MRTCCILVAAGSGTRLGKGPKAFLDIAGRPLLAWALEGVQQAGIDDVIVVLPEGTSLSEVLVTVQTLIAAIEAPGPAFPAKRATLAVLGTLRERLAVLDAHGGCAHFEVDV